jgi:hypothetical protein
LWIFSPKILAFLLSPEGPEYWAMPNGLENLDFQAQRA